MPDMASCSSGMSEKGVCRDESVNIRDECANIDTIINPEEPKVTQTNPATARIFCPRAFIVRHQVPTTTSTGFRQNVGAPTGSLDKIIKLFPKYVKY